MGCDPEGVEVANLGGGEVDVEADRGVEEEAVGSARDKPGGNSSEPSGRENPCMSIPRRTPSTSIMRGSVIDLRKLSEKFQ